MSDRYIVRLAVEKITETQDRNHANPTKTKALIANIVVGSTDLEKLKQKAAAHFDLIEDGGDIEDRREHVHRGV